MTSEQRSVRVDTGRAAVAAVQAFEISSPTFSAAAVQQAEHVPSPNRRVQCMYRGFSALASSRVPAVAAIDGWCIGAGVEMVAACDIRIATKSAKFALREVKVGIVPDLGGLSRLPHLIGETWARELALLGDDIDADTALRIGLVSHPPLVVAGIKHTMNARIDAEIARVNRDAAIQNGLLMQSEDFAEAMRAFMERRDPIYKGR